MVDSDCNTLAFISSAPPHGLDTGNGSLYGRVRKRSSEEGLSPPPTTSSPTCSDRAPSASSDSGLSVASQGRSGPRRRRGTQAGKLLSGADFEIAQPLLEVMSELAACGGGGEVETGEEDTGLGHSVNGEASSSERETDILDDEDDAAASALDLPSSSSMGSLSSENLPDSQRSAQTTQDYSTQSWVQQQQRVDVVTDNHVEVDGVERSSRLRKQRPPPLLAPDTPTRGNSSREAVQRANQNANVNAQQEEDLSSLTTDIDESIEQLNQLILDLDPTFVPVPTRCAPLSRSASLQTNGLSHKGNTHLSGKTTQNHPLFIPRVPAGSH